MPKNAEIKEVNLQNFLGLKCIYLKDDRNDLNFSLTISDIIDLLANSHGGIHHSNSEKNKIKPMSEIKDFHRFDVLFGSVGIYEANYDRELFKVAHNFYMVILNSLCSLMHIVQFDLKKSRPLEHTFMKTYYAKSNDNN